MYVSIKASGAGTPTGQRGAFHCTGTGVVFGMVQRCAKGSLAREAGGSLPAAATIAGGAMSRAVATFSRQHKSASAR